MKNILLPTDFSSNAYNAMRYALQIFKNRSSKFFLLHTFTPAIYPSGSMFNSYSSLELLDIIKGNAIENLENLQQKLKSEFKNPDHEFEISATFNLLVNEINEVVANKDIDLIIMGTQGATGAKEIFLGTNTMFTIKNVNCPVLAVPSDYEFAKLKEILFVTKFECVEENDLDLIKTFCDLYSAHLHILNVHNSEPLNKDQEKIRNQIAGFFDNEQPTFHFSADKDIPEAVEQFQKENNIDLIVMKHDKHSFFENLLSMPVINKLIYHTNIPFLVIPSEKH